jgi:arylformamidase
MSSMHRRAFMSASTAVLIGGPALVRGEARTVSDAEWAAMSRDARDASYNNAKAVPDSGQIVDGWIKASAEFRARNPKHIDVPYGPGERNKWDLFPAKNPKAPCLIFIHGGYWQARNREHFSCLAEGVLARGWSAALPGYTLAPAVSLTQIVAEIRSALDWLATHGGEHGISGPVVLTGWSAGGHLTAMMLDHPRIAAGIAMSGLFELGPIRDTYLNERLKLTDQEIASLSPLRLPSVNKPLAITYGSAELSPFVYYSREYHAYRARANYPGPLIPIPNANHFTSMEELRTPNGILTRAALRILEDAA